MSDATSAPPDEPRLRPFLTVREAAALLRVDPKTIYAAVDAGQLHHLLLGRKILISRDALCASAAGRRHR
jgi:excisionase family DNA binding protein